MSIYSKKKCLIWIIIFLSFSLFLLITSCSGSPFSDDSPVIKGELLRFDAVEDGTIQLNAPAWVSKERTDLPLIYISKDGSKWKTYSFTAKGIKYEGDEIQLKKGEQVYFVNSCDSFSLGENDFLSFSMTGKIKASGNIMSLLNWKSELTDYAFYSLFSDCSSLLSAPELPATELKTGCYQDMFYGCSSLRSIPSLKDISLSKNSCKRMFYSCTSLSVVKNLSVKEFGDSTKGENSGNLESMFENCSNLRTVIASLPEKDTVATKNWLKNVNSTGAIVSDNSSSFERPSGWEALSEKDYKKIYECETPSSTFGDLYGPLCFTPSSVVNGEDTPFISIVTEGLPAAINLQYRKYSDEQWYDYNIGNEITVDESVFFRRSPSDGLTNTVSTDGENYYKFVISAPEGITFDATGSLSCLLDSSGETIEVSDYAFYGLFKDCTALKTSPELPVVSLGECCFSHMFDGCTNLTEAPKLYASTLVEGCYSFMFSRCTNLKYIWTNIVNVPNNTNCITGWLNDTTGVTVVLNDITAFDEKGDIGGIISNQLKGLSFKNKSGNKFTIKLAKTGSPTEIDLIYCIDSDNNWNEFPINTEVTVENGKTITIKARTKNVGFSVDKNNYYKFVLGANCEVYGDVIDLLGSEYKGDGTSLPNNVFWRLFYGCKNMYQSSEADIKISAENLGQYCYYQMFYQAQQLTKIPDLPATTMADFCYNAMFQNCTGITATPCLPATNLARACYLSMFQGCTLLENAPELPATTLAPSCYSTMFSGCKKLKTAPKLPVLELENACYSSMFNGCTSLITAPELPSTMLAANCYKNMFNGCTSLENAPELPATTLAPSCYSNMFNGCTSLENAPELPATTLADNCYEYMFQKCSSLTTAPSLKATELKDYCYKYMFDSCSKLSNPSLLPSEKLCEGCYNRMYSSCAFKVGTEGSEDTLFFTCPNIDGDLPKNSVTDMFGSKITVKKGTSYYISK